MANSSFAQKQQQAYVLADILKVVAHPLRLMIICLLKDGEMYVQDIVDMLGTTKGNISQHLKILLLNKIVSQRHEGNRIGYSIKDSNIQTLIAEMEKIYCKK